MRAKEAFTLMEYLLLTALLILIMITVLKQTRDALRDLKDETLLLQSLPMP